MPALQRAPRLATGVQLRGQRRLENAAAARQDAAWQRAEQLRTVPPFPLACECGCSGCTATWAGTPEQYDPAPPRAAPVLAAEHT